MERLSLSRFIGTIEDRSSRRLSKPCQCGTIGMETCEFFYSHTKDLQKYFASVHDLYAPVGSSLCLTDPERATSVCPENLGHFLRGEYSLSSPKCIKDNGSIDGFLEHSSFRRWNQTKRGNNHKCKT